ncbi:hypothetical protein TPHA_0I00690 [Tetrapisispora phaffii CBS 4417]|uniref:Required for respiratory growth protein 7, mitochondrial n=1 Tax=Tetrapisispora phaffii (strain ATCC 24235 / CBS 4417 / NBRC 1672 / NRRL Y-8282 / UCD 70-5) TaxID=1071381 RepID=G8BXE7_TETPH|nr:hypothetical protein TPHA_0I00690 [Tetrapisispora phaffii CBS 4417]CCE64575.1 hypothetical protein TPHA_0I00690 [Tetrapisispora phaffii CBS 4417]
MLNKFLRRLPQRRYINNDNLVKYIKDNELIKDSKVFQGTLYEYTVIRELEQKLLMNQLKKVGGAHDGGVDITGKWAVGKIFHSLQDRNLINIDNHTPKRFVINDRSAMPIYQKFIGQNAVKNPRPLDILVQCKAFSLSKIGPKHIRELVGTYWSKVSPKKVNRTFMMICSPHLPTREGLKLLNSCNIPLLYVQVGMLNLMNNEYDLEKSGSLLNYYENEYASKLLQNIGIKEWLRLKGHKNWEG